MKGSRILVADDDAHTRTLFRRAAEAKGFVVLGAKDGREALEKARTQRPDLILLDVMMPEIDGRDVCRALRVDPATKDVPILIVSARGEQTDRRVGLELGADDYIPKPVSIDSLMRKIEYLLWKRRQGEHGTEE